MCSICFFTYNSIPAGAAAAAGAPRRPPSSRRKLWSCSSRSTSSPCRRCAASNGLSLLGRSHPAPQAGARARLWPALTCGLPSTVPVPTKLSSQTQPSPPCPRHASYVPSFRIVCQTLPISDVVCASPLPVITRSSQHQHSSDVVTHVVQGWAALGRRSTRATRAAAPHPPAALCKVGGGTLEGRAPHECARQHQLNVLLAPARGGRALQEHDQFLELQPPQLLAPAARPGRGAGARRPVSSKAPAQQPPQKQAWRAARCCRCRARGQGGPTPEQEGGQRVAQKVLELGAAGRRGYAVHALGSACLWTQGRQRAAAACTRHASTAAGHARSAQRCPRRSGNGLESPLSRALTLLTGTCPTAAPPAGRAPPAAAGS